MLSFGADDARAAVEAGRGSTLRDSMDALVERARN